MQHEILHAPDFTMLRITFDSAGEKAIAESGAMVGMSSEIHMETSMRGGLLAAAKRKLLGGESVFQNTYTSTAAGQQLLLAPPSEGDVRHLYLERGQTFYLQSGSYLAHIGDEMQIDTKWGGVKSFMSGVGFFMLKVTGPGNLYFCSYGALHEIEVGAAGYQCDTGHIVAFSSGLQYQVRKFGGFKGLFFSGEGLICQFNGQGKLYLQTRNVAALAAFLQPFRPVKSKD